MARKVLPRSSKFLKKSNDEQAGESVTISPGCARPVSYTHLDVYKRQLVCFFELACAISGYMSGVNPFDQPGVEAYKKNMFSLLGKPEAN